MGDSQLVMQSPGEYQAPRKGNVGLVSLALSLVTEAGSPFLSRAFPFSASNPLKQAPHHLLTPPLPSLNSWVLLGRYHPYLEAGAKTINNMGP